MNSHKRFWAFVPALALTLSQAAASTITATPLSKSSLVEKVQRDPCLHFHPSVGYYDGCTREGARMTREFDRRAYRYGYDSDGGNYRYRQRRPANDPCLHFHPSRGYYRVC